MVSIKQKLKNALLGAEATPGPWGMLAEFDGPDALAHAARALRGAGYKHFDVHSPYPIHGMDRAMGLGRSRIAWLVLGGGVTGGCGGLLLQWWINVKAYPQVISGKPYFSLPAFIPVAFELTILLAALGAFFGMLAMNALPRHYHPLLKRERFRLVTNDQFFVSIEARDPHFEAGRTRRLIEELGGRGIEMVEP